MESVTSLPGWHLVFQRWKASELVSPPDETVLEITEGLSETFSDRPLTSDPVVAKMRKLFKEAGTDPTRYRPSFEALARRILKGQPFPRVLPAVDLANLLSLIWRVPCCVSDEDTIRPPLSMRIGNPGQTMESLRGPFNLEGKPLLEDQTGPYSTPITDSKRAAVTADTKDVLFVAYFPEGHADPETIKQALAFLKLPSE